VLAAPGEGRCRSPARLSGTSLGAVTEARPLSPNEQALVDTLLAPAFAGVEALREQAKALLARPGCTGGCGTIDLLPQGDPPRTAAESPAPSEGRVRNAAGEEVGGLLLLIRHGLLESLEVYSYDEPLPLPLLADVDFRA
jgi:hypothetical protein